MRNLKTSIGIGALALALTATSVTPSFAGPFPAAPSVASTSEVTQVQFQAFGDRDGRWDRDRRDRRDRWDRRADSRHEWRGHRGYRDSRPGYRRHSDGYWYPLAAFGAAAIIGSAIANGNKTTRTVTVYDRAAEWCSNRYRSYRASDNTYQPLSGPRVQCDSPY